VAPSRTVVLVAFDSYHLPSAAMNCRITFSVMNRLLSQNTVPDAVAYPLFFVT
jgi:hypothetical protein